MRIYDLESIKRKKSANVKWIRRIMHVFFIVFVFAYIYNYYDSYTLDSLKRTASYISLAHKSDVSEVTIDVSTKNSSKTYAFGSGIINVDDDFATFFNLAGEIDSEIAINYQNPNVALGKNHAIIYDLGFYNLAIANSYGALYKMETQYRILGMGIDDNENYVIITDEMGYIGSVATFNSKNEQTFKWSTSTYNVINAKIDGNNLLTMNMYQDGINFKSNVILFDISKGESIFEYAFDDQFPIDAHIFPNGNICVVFQNQITFLSSTGAHIKDISNIALKAYNIDNEHNIIYVEDNFDNTYTLKLYDKTATLIATHTFEDSVEKIEVTSNYIYILTSEKLYKYDFYFNLIKEEQVQVGVFDILCFENNTIYAVYSDKLIRIMN